MVWHIGEILIQKKLITWDQLNRALEEQKKTRELTGEILVRNGFVSRKLLFKALADQHHMPFVDLRRVKINPAAVALLPKSVAQTYLIMPVELCADTLTVAVSNPVQLWPEADLKQITRMRELSRVLCLPEDVSQAIAEYYHEHPAAETVWGRTRGTGLQREQVDLR